jgi:two-component system response regulator MprA
MRILVVDDDSIVRMSLRTMLTAEGFNVTTAADGEEAVLKLSEERFDLVVCDVYMPNMDGLKVRSVVRDTHATEKLPILFISGHDDPQTMNIVRDHTLEGFFRKGKPVSEMLAWVKYLSTPLYKRPSIPPHIAAKVSSQHRAYDRGRGNSRAPIL